MNQSISPATKLMALIGNPVGHSLSPAIQNALIHEVGDDAVYLAFGIQPEQVQTAMEAMRALPIYGMNVTAPYKQAVMPYLDAIDPKSKKFGAVNVIKNDNGRLIGYNTDVEGLFMYLKQKEVFLQNKSVLIFGAGGLSTSLLTGIWDENPASVTVINRTMQKAQALANMVKETWGHSVKTSPKGSPYDVVINASTAGMHPHEDTCPCEDLTNIVDSHTVLVDCIYNPEKTLLMKKAETLGATTLNGFGMLVCQALLSYEIFTGKALPSSIYQDFIQRKF